MICLSFVIWLSSKGLLLQDKDLVGSGSRFLVGPGSETPNDLVVASHAGPGDKNQTVMEDENHANCPIVKLLTGPKDEYLVGFEDEP